MATNTAGSKGYHKSDSNVRIVRGRRFTYEDLESTTSTNLATVCVLPPRSFIFGGGVYVITGFNDTSGDDVEVGFSSDNDALEATLDVNSAGFTAFGDFVANDDAYSASERTVTINLETAATGDGTAGELYVYVEYIVIPASSVTGA